MEPASTVDVAFQVSGQILEIVPEEGTRVAAGTVIAQIDPVDYELALRRAEAVVAADPEVTDVTTFVGRGASRFMLTYQPEQVDPSYGHLIVRAKDYEAIPAIFDRLAGLPGLFPQGQLRFERIVFGPPRR